jgi:type II secretory pathway component PulJ
MMISFFSQKLKGFTLVDVMMGVVLSTVLLFLMMGFVQEVMLHQQVLAQHQQIRSDLFRLTHDVLPKVLRESTGIDYEQTDDQVLSLFTDVYEQQSLQFIWREDEEGLGELIYKQDDKELRLHGSRTIIESVEWGFPKHPAQLGSDRLQQLRALQPMVSFRIQARFNADQVIARPVRLAYQGATALHNVSLASYRH